MHGVSANSVTLLCSGGYAKAAYICGQLAYDGLGNVPQSNATAAHWFRNAAKAGIPQALYMLGLITAQGAQADNDFPKLDRNDDAAKALFAKAAALGNADAANALKSYDTDHPPA